MLVALVALAVALAASVWTIAYALQEPLADLIWLHRLRQWDAWWDSIDDMHVQLDAVIVADNIDMLEAVA